MDFDTYKQGVLDKLYTPDRSRKGSVDTFIVSLIDLINAHPDYVTTSSCSGRMMLHTQASKKYATKWLFVSHKKTELASIMASLKNLPDEDVWFKTEGFIFHVACRDFQAAKSFMILAQQNGYKNSSILAASKRFIVQIIDSRRFDCLIGVAGELVVDHNYLALIGERANSLLKDIHAGITRLQNAWSRSLGNDSRDSSVSPDKTSDVQQ